MMRCYLSSRVLFAGCVLAVAGVVARGDAQTLEEGLDHPAGLGPITVKSTDLDGVAIGTGLWEYTTADSHDGVDAVRAVVPNRAESTLTTSVQGPAVISFWWKILAERNFDKLEFRSGNDVATIRMPLDQPQPPVWQQRTFQVDTGNQPIEWLFQRLSSLPVNGTGQAWIDELVVTPIPNNPALQGAVENFAFNLHSTDWTAAPLDGAINSDVAKSGPVEPGDISTMVLQVEGPATISFRWGVASDPSDNSAFRFLVNNESYESLTGTQSLQSRTFEVPPGTQRLKFLYERDGSSGDPFYEGPSEGYLDQLVITPFGESASLADAVDLPDGVYSNAWTRQTTTTHDGSDAAFASTPTAGAARRLYAKIPDGAGLLTFWTKTNIDPVNGLLRVLVDGATVLERNTIGDWQKTEVNLEAGDGRLLEAILFRDASTNTSVSSAWLDGIVFQPGVDNFQPDLGIGPRNKNLKGLGVVNASGTGQESKIRAKGRRPAGLYSIRFVNRSASDPDEFTVRGRWNDRDFEVFFVVKEGGKRLNYTAAFKAGLFSTIELDPGDSETHELWVVRKPEAKGKSHVLRATGRSTTSPGKIDTVRTKLKIAR